MINALRLPDGDKGYYHYQGSDGQNADCYTIPIILKKLEAIAKQWENNHPDLAPLMKDIFITYPGPNANGNLDSNDDDRNGIDDIQLSSTKSEVRIGIGDISTKDGGYSGHSGHQNGLCIDVSAPSAAWCFL